MALSVHAFFFFFFLATCETEQTVLILHVQPRSNIHLSLWLCRWQWTFKYHTGQGSLVGVSIPGGYCVLSLMLFTCVFWIPLTRNLARKTGVMTDRGGCECVCVCVRIYVLVNPDTHEEQGLGGGGVKRIKYPCQFQAKSCRVINIRSCCLIIHAARFSNHRIQSQLAAAKTQTKHSEFCSAQNTDSFFFCPFAAAACWRRQQRSQNR